jgi:hypothetical protein
MKSFLLLLVICCQYTSINSFLLLPANTTWIGPGRNVTCFSQSSVNYNGTTTYYGGFINYYVDYCFVVQETTQYNGMPQVSTNFYFIAGVNYYRNVGINQCGFSPSMDIGYGSCTPLSYQLPSSIILCICSTNNCSASLSACQASVNQTMSSPPPLLPSMTPTLTNSIMCQDSTQIYDATHNITPIVYTSCTSPLLDFPYDPVACAAYALTHTVACLINYDALQGSYYPMALFQDSYEYFVFWLALDSSSLGVDSESSSSIVTIYYLNPSYNAATCICTTNNCNINFTTCSNGTSFPQGLLAFNGSTSPPPSSAPINTTITTSTVTGSQSASQTTTLTASTVTGSHSASQTTTLLTSFTNATNRTTLPTNSTVAHQASARKINCSCIYHRYMCYECFVSFRLGK